jgi:hypothetical protein
MDIIHNYSGTDISRILKLGGIEVEHSNAGIVILEGNKAYDSHSNQWMTPQLDFISTEADLWTDVTKIHTYRLVCN